MLVMNFTRASSPPPAPNYTNHHPPQNHFFFPSQPQKTTEDRHGPAGEPRTFARAAPSAVPRDDGYGWTGQGRERPRHGGAAC